MENTHEFMDHPSFDSEHHADAVEYIISIARPYGLIWEVEETFNNILSSAFQGNDYPISHSQYFDEANNALDEWDI